MRFLRRTAGLGWENVEEATATPTRDTSLEGGQRGAEEQGWERAKPRREER